ncbi:hypothetical protein VTK73DRAFT_2943 [Phialemonium thermophilum]|uniref:Uncharacterized protein n=1 Tax=Phialemonium thermophilum TaxID=223376 RepID=A0ABR3VMA4_9PEZI
MMAVETLELNGFKGSHLTFQNSRRPFQVLPPQQCLALSLLTMTCTAVAPQELLSGWKLIWPGKLSTSGPGVKLNDP